MDENVFIRVRHDAMGQHCEPNENRRVGPLCRGPERPAAPCDGDHGAHRATQHRRQRPRASSGHRRGIRALAAGQRQLGPELPPDLRRMLQGLAAGRDRAGLIAPVALPLRLPVALGLPPGVGFGAGVTAMPCR